MAENRFTISKSIFMKKKEVKKFTERHNDGSLWATGIVIDGKMVGYWKWFRKDGSVMPSGHFKKGKQTGKWTTYNKSGKVVKVADLTSKQ